MADKFKTDSFHMERVVLEFLEKEVTERIKDFPISLKINGNMIDIDDIEYTEEGVKVIAVYHNQPGFFKDDIQNNPETFDPKDHSALFTEEEKINLSQSMRPE